MSIRFKSHEERLREQRDKFIDPERNRKADALQMKVDGMRRSRAWKAARERALRARPLCVDPFGRHADVFGGVPAKEVNHITPARQRLDLFFRQTNLAPLCVPCHHRVTAMERRGEDTTHLFSKTEPPGGVR